MQHASLNIKVVNAYFTLNGEFTLQKMLWGILIAALFYISYNLFVF